MNTEATRISHYKSKTMEETTLANLYQKYTYLLVEIVKKSFEYLLKNLMRLNILSLYI